MLFIVISQILIRTFAFLFSTSILKSQGYTAPKLLKKIKNKKVKKSRPHNRSHASFPALAALMLHYIYAKENKIKFT